MNYKKIAAITLSAASVFSMPVCNGSDSFMGNTLKTFAAQAADTNGSLEDVAGGWAVNQESISLSKHKEAEAAFEKAVNGIAGYQYKVVAYLGSQVVAGTYYAYLCKGSPVVLDAKSEYMILYVYQDLQGNAEIADTKKFFDAGEGNAAGAWSYNQGSASLSKNKGVARVYQKAMKGITGASYKPIAYLGRQSAAGTNYAVFCRRTLASPGAETDFAVVYVHKNLKGRVKILEIADVEIGKDVLGVDAGDADGSDAALGADTGNGHETVETASPFIQVHTLEEAAEIAGFCLTVPDAPSAHPDSVIQAVEGTMIEVIFVDAKNETAEGPDEAYRIRKAAAGGDVSGDYNEYVDIQTHTIGDSDVVLKGSGGNWSVAIWESGGYSYAVDAQDCPLSTETMADIIDAVK